MPAHDPRILAMRASLAISFLMLAGKLTAWKITGSTAILSDAMESVVHLGATGMAAFSLWYAALPPDRPHPYGHGRIAYFSAGVEGALIAVAALSIVYAAIVDLIRGPELRQLGWGLAITGALAAINLALGLVLIHVGRRYNALILVANGRHVLTDMWTSVGVVGGVAVVWLTGVSWLDPAVAIAVGVNILWTSYRLVRQSYEGLMDRADPERTARLLKQLRAAVDQGLIKDFHHLRHRRINDETWVEVHLISPSDIRLSKAHEIATRIEDSLRGLFPAERVHVTSHMEPPDHAAAHPGGHAEAIDPYEK